MAKDDNVIEVEGKITETFPGSKFQIELTTEGFEGHIVKEAKLSGKMRMHYIRIVKGDKVRLEISAADPELKRGRITYRFK
ncbi:MAG: translation initiation factor IF-1 [Candidatus Peregrinibacteria bacterium]|nr:translation initiation factor IF-1 [Candidatus Peregrinibacteria bacterium]